MDGKENNFLQGIDTVIIRVADITISKGWYENKLGLNAIWEDPNLKLAVLDTNSPTSLTLWQTDKKVTIDKDISSYPIFKTSDATALREQLNSKGIELGEVIQDDYTKYFFFFDLMATYWRPARFMGKATKAQSLYLQSTHQKRSSN